MHNSKNFSTQQEKLFKSNLLRKMKIKSSKEDTKTLLNQKIDAKIELYRV